MCLDSLGKLNTMMRVNSGILLFSQSVINIFQPGNNLLCKEI